MKRSATTLSKLGRRIIVQFMLAVSLPLAVLGTLTHGALTTQAETQDQQQLDAEVSAEAMRVLDRLLAARAALQQLARSSERPDAAADPGGVFVAVTTVPDRPAGVTVPVGSPAQVALQRWWHDTPPAERQPLVWRPVRPGQPAVVMVTVEEPSRGVRWLAEVDPAFLWADIFGTFEARRACVSDTAGQLLHCASALDHPGAAAGAPGPRRVASKDLFLRKEFGVADWRFRADRPAERLTDVPVGGIVFQAVAAALLLVLTLSLVQVRRTMGPLQQLVAVTRRLARQDYGARVALAGDDEFRELGESFNDMAAQTEAQIDELRMLAAIDRHILESPDLERLFAGVLDHLGGLMPAATVALCEVQAGASTTLRCHARNTEGARPVTLHDPPPAAWRALTGHDGGTGWLEPGSAAAAWVAGMIEAPGPWIYRAAAVARGRTQAVLLIAPTGAHEPSPAWQRPVDELRQRLAVAVAAAAHEQQLVHQATHDSLTGLRNRSGLYEALEAALVVQEPFAVLFADLDRFKGVNDGMGHQAGDELLRMAAQRVRAAAPPDALIARPGGDEFVVLLRGPHAHGAAHVAEAICRTLADAFTLGGREAVLGASVGWALYPDDGGSANELMRHADMAMYSAKDSGRGRAARFRPQMDVAAAQHAWVVNDLRRAVERRQLLLHYQPRVDTHSGLADTAEALVRWQHPTHGLVSPALFVEVAEEIGVIHELGRWVLREACRQVAQWRRNGVPIACVSVNLSALQLADPTLVEQVVAALDDHGLLPGNLELEVTESALVGDQSLAADLLARLRALGIAIALDDFGTGYSSMAYLSKMPVDVIKVDRAFVKNLGQDRSADTVTRAIVTLAHSLNLRLVAEGVETPEQAQLLQGMGCHQLQGYLYSRPVPAAVYPSLGCVRQAEPAVSA